MPLVDNLKQQAFDLLLQKKYEEASILYGQLIETETDVVSHYWYAGLALLLQGQEAEAQLTWLAVLSQADPDRVESWTADLVSVLRKNAEHQEATGALQTSWLIRQHICELVPTDFNNLLMIIALASSVGDFATYAEPALTQATQLLREKRVSHLEPESLLQAINALADVDPNHPFFLALLQVEVFSSGSGIYAAACDRLSQVYAQAGANLLAQEKTDEAEAAFRAALSLESGLTSENVAVAHFNLGICLFKQKRWQEAKEHFQRVYAIDPNFPQIQLQLSRVNYYLQSIPKGYRFSGDWFGRNVHIWETHLLPFANRPDFKVLEIGSWEGRSTCWLLENLLTHPSSQITCVDTFAGGGGTDFSGNDNRDTVESRFDFNVAQTGSPAEIIKKIGTSREVLRSLPLNTYDMVYIDGSHVACDALEDACLSWGLIKVGAIIIFDDYDFHFANSPEDDTHVGIDAFMTAFSGKLRLIHQSYQVILEKVLD